MTAAEVGDPARRCNLWDFISSRVHRKLLMHSGCPAQIWSMRSSNGSISLEKVSFWLRYREDAFQILPRYHFVLSWHFYFLISHSLRVSASKAQFLIPRPQDIVNWPTRIISLNIYSQSDIAMPAYF